MNGVPYEGRGILFEELSDVLASRRRGERGIRRPLLSVVMPTFLPDLGKLRESIDSVLALGAQFEVEALVIDGWSGEEVIEELRRLPDEVRWLSSPDSGCYHAMNRGIVVSRGDYLMFLGAGDRVLAENFSQVAGHLKRGALRIVYGSCFMEDIGQVYGGRFDFEELRRRNICHQAMLYSRRVFQKIGLYDAKYPILADYDLNLRALLDGRIEMRFVDAMISRYEGNGLSASNRDPEFEGDWFWLRKEFPKHIDRLGMVQQGWIESEGSGSPRTVVGTRPPAIL